MKLVDFSFKKCILSIQNKAAQMQEKYDNLGDFDKRATL
jgi:hypothetical protein